MVDSSKNFRQLIPCIRVNDVNSTMEYYICELGFKPRYFIKGNPESGGVEINDIAVDFISGEVGRADTSLNFLVEDVDTLYSFCRKRKLFIILEPQNTNGMRLFGIKDINGYRLFFYNWIKKPLKRGLSDNNPREIPERFKKSIMQAAIQAIKDSDVELLKKLITLEPTVVDERIECGHSGDKFHTLLHVLVDSKTCNINDKSAEIARILIKSGADVDALDGIDKGNTPLQLLVRAGCQNNQIGNVAKVLIDANARLNDPFKNESGMNAFCTALLNGHTYSAKLMFPKITRPGLIWLAGVGEHEIVDSFFGRRDSDEFRKNCRYFLFEEASDNFVPERNPMRIACAYIIACINGQNRVIEILLNRGVNVNTLIPGRDFAGIGATGLHWAAHHGHIDTVKLLVRKGADNTAKDDTYSLSPAAWAAKNGHSDIADFLMGLGDR